MSQDKSIVMPMGVVVRRMPGVTRWAKWSWKPVAVLPGAGPANWQEMRHDGDAVEFHAGTIPMTLFRTDTEAYLDALNAPLPSVYVVMRAAESGPAPWALHSVTASSYEAQDHADSGEDMVEPVPMPPGLIAWIRAFVEQHHEDVAFVKRRRDKTRVDRKQDGIGDARIRQTADVYRAPTGKRRLQ